MQFHLQFENDSTLTEEKFVEYKIMIHPGEKVTEATINLKKLLQANCNDNYSFKSPPHLTLASFLLDEQREELLIKYLDKFTSAATPFNVSVGGINFFDAIAGKGVAYLSVQSKEPIIQLQVLLNVVLKIDVRVNKKHLLKTNEPHITIGKDLDIFNLNKSKELFAGKEFSANFTVEKLVLLKKCDQNQPYEICKEFYFF